MPGKIASHQVYFSLKMEMVFLIKSLTNRSDSQLEERLLMWLEYHPLVASCARGDIGPQFAMKYRLPIPQHAPFAIGYTFEDNPHQYLPEVVGTLAGGTPF